VRENPIGTIKRVSGKLLRMFGGQTELREGPPLPRLLIVDDEESICFSMSEYFEHHGFKVDAARDIDEAEKLIQNNEYKVVIQDLRLGINKKADGLEIIKILQMRQPEARIIVLTAYGSPEIEDEAIREGADAFLRKPKPLSQVAQVVQGLLESPKHAVRSA
jgi:DNA-binding NtrC family response regulator